MKRYLISFLFWTIMSCQSLTNSDIAQTIFCASKVTVQKSNDYMFLGISGASCTNPKEEKFKLLVDSLFKENKEIKRILIIKNKSFSEKEIVRFYIGQCFVEYNQYDSSIDYKNLKKLPASSCM